MSLCIVCFVVSTPVFRNGAGRQVYMFIALSGLVNLVMSGMCSYVDRLLLIVVLYPYRGLAGYVMFLDC